MVSKKSGSPEAGKQTCLLRLKVTANVALNGIDSSFFVRSVPSIIMSKTETRIYVGNLPPDIRNKDIEDLFYKYGKIAFIDLKNRRGPPFAFVEFEDAR